MKTFASLFSGREGAEMGAIATGLKPIWGIELEPKIAEVAAVNVGHQLIVKSIDRVNINRLERPDILWASPPCQAFSCARSKKLEARCDADIGLAIISYLSILQPSYFFLENVEGYRHSSVFCDIVDNLYKLGYWTNWDVLNAADFGVPQTRRRLILRAVKGGFVPALPQKERWVGWYEAIADLIPTLPETEFAPWQLCRMPELKRTSIVDAHNTSREATIRDGESPVHCLTVGGLNRPGTIPKAFLIGDNSHRQPLKQSGRGFLNSQIRVPVSLAVY